ncbi:hypothetical protein IFT48_05110 [Pseudomonas fluorescens]|uniref:hypothetical protein n=1 Tax=Pseudomonas TaxID=286 RepID=UPI000F042E66|nr:MULTISPECIES: hypothetical protein [Pseudomonas]MBD8089355.1 hypothetical protein [Pseudomonas fluorescens]MBD8615218.1 hypothetical protein [Pseudomonas putida]MBD8682128.1 hypothetical protein [Pseudomonas sp. CFBP 13719]
MSEIALSFDQLRQDIFEGVLRSLGGDSYSELHTALMYGQDPRAMILPYIGSCIQLNNYGTLILPFKITNHPDLQLSVVLTLGRLNYTIHAHKDIAEICNMRTTIPELSAELGLKCQQRDVKDGVRFELCNDPTLVWAPTAINILRSPQLEHAFKEFVRLQADRLIAGISEVLASKGICKPADDGIYCVAVFRNMGFEKDAHDLIGEDFEILNIDKRDPMNVLYALQSKKPTPAPIMLCDGLAERLTERGYTCSIQPSWQHGDSHDSMIPFVTERIVVETQVVEVAVQPPEMDWRSKLRDPIID